MPDIQVLGVVPNREAAEHIVGNVRVAGFEQDNVSVIMVQPEEAQQLDTETEDQTGEGAADVVKSAAAGAGIGGATGVLAGLATLAIPGLGPIIGSGILVALFGGAGGLVGALTGAFASEDTSQQVIERYGMALREGQAIVCVTAHDRDQAKQVEDIFNRLGVANVNSYFEDVSPLTEQPGVKEVSE